MSTSWLWLWWPIGVFFYILYWLNQECFFVCNSYKVLLLFCCREYLPLVIISKECHIHILSIILGFLILHWGCLHQVNCYLMMKVGHQQTWLWILILYSGIARIKSHPGGWLWRLLHDCIGTNQGCTYARRQNFITVSPNIYGSLVWNLLCLKFEVAHWFLENVLTANPDWKGSTSDYATTTFTLSPVKYFLVILCYTSWTIESFIK